MLSLGPLGLNSGEILMEIQIFSFKKMRLKMLSAKWQPSCIGPKVFDLKYRAPHNNLIKINLRFIMRIAWLL